MNYIRHLNAFFSYVKADNRLTSSHVSLYMAIFQYWNYSRFQNPFPIHRDKLMQLSKIGSKNTYHKCLKDLHLAQYIYCHRALSKFQAIKISIIRLDQKEEKNNTQQLDVFDNAETESHSLKSVQPNKTSLSPNGKGLEGRSCPIIDTDMCPTNDTQPCLNNDTGTVPILNGTSTDFNTGTVPNMGHSIKQNIYKTLNSVCKIPTKIFEKNIKISEAINGFAPVPKMVLNQNSESIKDLPALTPLPPLRERLGVSLLSKDDVETFFKENNYPIPEAQKFYYYNHSKGWMLTEKIPIKDWQSLAHKWMLNENQKPKPNGKANDHTGSNKDYSQPL